VNVTKAMIVETIDALREAADKIESPIDSYSADPEYADTLRKLADRLERGIKPTPTPRADGEGTTR